MEVLMNQRASISLSSLFRLALVVMAACPLQALAQQQLPSKMRDSDFKFLQQLPAQLIPRKNLDGPTGNDSTTPLLARPIDSETCAMTDVGTAELKAVRASILNTLGTNTAAVTSFTKAEQQIPPECVRRRVTYYIRVIAQIQGAK